MGESVLITGGLGFIGSHIVELAQAQGLKVFVIDNLTTGSESNAIDGVEYLLGDIRDKSLYKNLESENISRIFHVAALPRIQPSFEFPQESEEVNVIGSIKVFEFAKLIGVKSFVYSSSASVYGDTGLGAVCEDSPIRPLSPYAVQKYAAEQILLILGNRYGIPVTALRYFNPFGQRSYIPTANFSAYSPVLGIFEHNKINGLPSTITGNGEQRRDFVYVGDVAQANLLASNRKDVRTSQVYNICSGKTYSILEIAVMLKISFNFEPARPGEARFSLGCNCRAQKELGWRPSMDLKDYILNIGN